MSIPRWAFVIEKICDGQIADGEYPGNRCVVVRVGLDLISALCAL